MQTKSDKTSIEVSESRTAGDFALHFVFRAYGATVRIDCSDQELFDKVAAIAYKSFLGRIEVIDDFNAPVDYSFGIARSRGKKLRLYENERPRTGDENETLLFRFFTGYLRVIVAERADRWVFVHAGTVGLRGRAVIIPGNSYSGKSTLVSELVRRGAEYFSDEYAVFDESGLVHPFPSSISIRIGGDRLNVTEIDPAVLGVTTAVDPAPVGLVLITQFAEGNNWNPERLSVGNAIKELVPHTISIRHRTAFSLKVLNMAVNRAIILKGLRGEASRIADVVFELMDNDTTWS